MEESKEDTTTTTDAPQSREKLQQEDAPSAVHEPSMTVSLFVYWIIPLLFIALFSRKIVNTEVPIIPLEQPPSRPAQTNLGRNMKQEARIKTERGTVPASPQPREIVLPTSWPTAYKDVVTTIHKRRRHIDGFPGGISAMVMSASGDNETGVAVVDVDASGAINAVPPSRSRRPTDGRGREDPKRARFREKIQDQREDYRRHPEDIYRAIAFADGMRFYDMQFHEGGTYELEALELYDEIIRKLVAKRRAALLAGQVTNQVADASIASVNDEVTLDYQFKSLDGQLCGMYTAKGKLCFMANMFERAVEAYEGCLDEIYPYYLDALNGRASSFIVLGKYEQAGHDFLDVIRRDSRHLFLDAFTGLARILEAKEDVVPEGWDSIIPTVEVLIRSLEQQLELQPQIKQMVADALNRLHHVLFTYHDVKTKDYPKAFRHLTRGFEHKMSILPPWVAGSEKAKILQTKNIFKKGFWPPGTGSQTRAPIFIIGFVRSGSTLLERILDAHPMIAGTGENSVFNGRLGDIRNQIVQVSTVGGQESLEELTTRLAEEVVDEMRRRWLIVDSNTEKSDNETENNGSPQRFTDKMLTNYYNVGFIQLLYPNALILHVAREPMDSIFSAYKHEFPAGTLDYTSDYVGLAELYHTYRDIMEHWDVVLPGRITHIRYEDMVKDFAGTARAIIAATGLPWDDSVLEFHTKKHAVNTLSSTQVRKGVYKDSLKSWMRYEKELQHLINPIGERINYDFKTTLPGYRSSPNKPTGEQM